MPVPKTCAHWRLTNTRAVSGLSGATSQSATAVRRPDEVAVGTMRGFGLGDRGARVGHEAREAIRLELVDDGLEDRVLLRAEVLRRLFPFRELGAVLGEDDAVRRLHVVVPARVREEGLELVVLLLR